jgi:hypothetical protein
MTAMSQRAAFATLAAAAAAVILASSLYIQRTPERPDLSAEAAGIAEDYADALRGALKAAGPAGAAAFCHDQAPAIAAEITRRTGWTVGRTSLAARNPASAPDGYERTVMAGFNELIAVGTPLARLRESDILGRDGERVFRYVQAIPADAACVACHGGSVGDMLGVFTLKKAL